MILHISVTLLLYFVGKLFLFWQKFDKIMKKTLKQTRTCIWYFLKWRRLFRRHHYQAVYSAKTFTQCHKSDLGSHLRPFSRGFSWKESRVLAEEGWGTMLKRVMIFGWLFRLTFAEFSSNNGFVMTPLLLKLSYSRTAEDRIFSTYVGLKQKYSHLTRVRKKVTGREKQEWQQAYPKWISIRLEIRVTKTCLVAGQNGTDNGKSNFSHFYTTWYLWAFKVWSCCDWKSHMEYR